MRQLALIGRRHQHEPRQATQVRDVERAGMGLAVGSHQARPVQRESNRETLNRNVVNDLVVGALQECRIDRRERLHSVRRQPRRKGHGVLLGNPDVEDPRREDLFHDIDAGARRHRRRDRADPIIPARLRQ